MTKTVVLVHGAWTAGWVWHRVADRLHAAGVPVLAPDLPGRGDAPGPLGDLPADAAALGALLAEIDGEVVLAGHSYGGAVMSQAAPAAAAAHLVYVAGFCLDAGESFMPLRLAVTDDRTMADATRRTANPGEVVVDPAAARDVLFNRAPDAVAADAVARLGPHLARTFWQPVDVAAWREVEATYVRCGEDRALPPAVQDVMAARCDAVVALDADHHPHLSAPDELAALLEDRAAR